MNWYPQQLSTAEQMGASVLFCFQKAFVEKGMFLSTQALFTAEQAAADVFVVVFLKHEMPSWKRSVLLHICQ